MAGWIGHFEAAALQTFGYELDGGAHTHLWKDPTWAYSVGGPHGQAASMFDDAYGKWQRTKKLITAAEVTGQHYRKEVDRPVQIELRLEDGGRIVEWDPVTGDSWGGEWRITAGADDQAGRWYLAGDKGFLTTRIGNAIGHFFADSDGARLAGPEWAAPGIYHGAAYVRLVTLP